MTSRLRRVVNEGRQSLRASFLCEGKLKAAFLVMLLLAASSSVASAQDSEGEEIDALLGIEDSGGGETSVEGGDDNGDLFLPLTPTVDGGTGLFRVRSAQTTKDLSVRMWIAAQTFSGSDVVRANDENSRFVGSLGFSMTPLPWLEPYLVFNARSNHNTFNDPETVLTQGDLNLGSKAVYPIDKAFHVGGDLQLLMLTDPEGSAFGYSGSATSLKISALGTFDGTELPDPIPVKAHLNLGYFLDQSDQLLPEDGQGRKLLPSRTERFAQNLSAFNQIMMGLGVEVPLEYVTPSIEYNLGILTGDEPDALCADQPLACPSDAGFGGNPQSVTLGVKGMPVRDLIVNAGLEIGLTSKDVQGVPVTAPYNVMFGVAYAFDPRGREKIVIQEKIVEREKIVEVKPKEGIVVGKVVDSDTGKPLRGAVVEYPDTDFNGQVVNKKDGSFRSYGLPPKKEVVVRISAPDYKAKKKKLTLKEGDNEMTIKLRPAGKTGVIAATIVDDRNQPASGEVILTGPKVYKVKLEGGKFSQKVLVGQYTLSFVSPGFLTAGRDVSVASKKNYNLDLKLSKRPETTAVEIVENRIVLDGKIEFDGEALTEDSKALLDQVAATLWEQANFSRVRVESHVDESGKAAKRLETTEMRAKLVRDYLVSKGVSEKRLEAKGFGSDQPLVPNTSKINRNINRRIEFVVVSRRGK